VLRGFRRNPKAVRPFFINTTRHKLTPSPGAALNPLAPSASFTRHILDIVIIPSCCPGPFNGTAMLFVTGNATLEAPVSAWSLQQQAKMVRAASSHQ
jgi:hypothetical protein